MSDIAIRVENLSKQYRIGKRERYKTVRESILGLLSRTAQRFRGNRDDNDERTFWALNDVSFDVQRGEVLGIIGRNGAGKSTLLKVLSQITEPTRGRIEITGRVGSLLEVGTGFHPELTGRENVFLNGSILGMRRGEIAAKFDEIVAFAEVEKFLDTPVKHYSSGMYTRLAFAVAAHLEPEILIVDEVLAVGDAQFQKKCMGRMGEVAREGRTVLFVSHNMGAIENLCTSAILLESGRCVSRGPASEMVERYLQQVAPLARNGTQLEHRTDRSGNGSVRLTSFRIENEFGQPLIAARSGMKTTFVFGFRCAGDAIVHHIDIGFSIAAGNERTLSVLYASYQGQTIESVQNVGEFRCTVDRLPLAAGVYFVGARVVVAGDEADWPANGVGELAVEPGDFFGTGSGGFGSGAPLLLAGEWSVKVGSGQQVESVL